MDKDGASEKDIKQLLAAKTVIKEKKQCETTLEKDEYESVRRP